MTDVVARAPVSRLRRTIRRGLVGLAAFVVLCAGLLGWGFLIEPDRLVVSHHELTLARWPAGYPPLRVAAIADLHAGSPFVDLAKIERIVAETNAQAPDVIVLLGDYVIQGVPFGRRLPIEPVAAALGKLHARLGVFAVLGNHDWWDDGANIRRAFERAGIPVLDNEAVRREVDGQPVWIAGLADAMTRRPSWERALAGTGSDPVIAITHNPVPYHTMPDRPAILIAGHTHGGQVRLPFIGSLITARGIPNRWMFGHIKESEHDMFVSTGIGTSIMPVRFLTPPVIDVLDIRPSASTR
ncbi:MAG: metallophosphoesterase [Alphaproteobacteria bacterium]|nr:metallophosphoesterase [Alphaproteobacteria bacterium]